MRVRYQQSARCGRKIFSRLSPDARWIHEHRLAYRWSALSCLASHDISTSPPPFRRPRLSCPERVLSRPRTSPVEGKLLLASRHGDFLPSSPESLRTFRSARVVREGRGRDKQRPRWAKPVVRCHGDEAIFLDKGMFDIYIYMYIRRLSLHAPLQSRLALSCSMFCSFRRGDFRQ